MALNICVLIKQVPNTSQVKIDPVTNNLVREGIPNVVNPYDLYAVEAALQLREQEGGRVTALSMGPRAAREALKQMLALGVDEAVLLTDRAFAGADTLATSYTLAAALRELGPFELILCGKQAADGDTAQVPGELAEHLGLSCATAVRALALTEDGRVVVERDLEQAVLRQELQLPAVLTLNKGLNEPRRPRLADLVAAVTREVRVLGAADLALDETRISLAGSPTQVVRVFTPNRRKQGRMLAGTAQEQVGELLAHLAEQEIWPQRGERHGAADD